MSVIRLGSVAYSGNDFLIEIIASGELLESGEIS